MAVGANQPLLVTKWLQAHTCRREHSLLQGPHSVRSTADPRAHHVPGEVLVCDWLAGPLLISDISGATQAARAGWKEGAPPARPAAEGTVRLEGNLSVPQVAPPQASERLPRVQSLLHPQFSRESQMGQLSPRVLGAWG